MRGDVRRAVRRAESVVDHLRDGEVAALLPERVEARCEDQEAHVHADARGDPARGEPALEPRLPRDAFHGVRGEERRGEREEERETVEPFARAEVILHGAPGVVLRGGVTDPRVRRRGHGGQRVHRDERVQPSVRLAGHREGAVVAEV
eukprot:30891-Pelagococcus_subviridis.AAC.13